MTFWSVVQAAEGPIEPDSARWMSLQSYENHEQRHPEPKKLEKAAPDPVLPSDAAAVSEPASKDSVVTKIEEPAMPGMNRGFNIKVHSTDDETERESQITTAEPSKPGPSEEKWKSLSQEKTDNEEKSEDVEGSDSPSSKVRMTFLPSRNILPAPKPEHVSGQKNPREFFKKLAEEERNKKRDAQKKNARATPEDKAASEVLEAYRKQQLEAIQSDRQTLKALQNAIRSLGLTERLDFVAEGGSLLAAPKDNQTTVPDGAPQQMETR